MKQRERDDDQAEGSPLSHPIWHTLPAATLLLLLLMLCAVLNRPLLDQFHQGDPQVSLLSTVIPVLITLSMVLLALLWGVYLLHTFTKPPHQDQRDNDEW